MADILEYKCPSCGGAMEFDSKTQKMKCPYCDTELDVGQFQEHGTGEKEKKNEGQTWEEEETSGMKVYVCQSCGGEIIADENTGASSCPFCGSPVVVKGQFEGGLRPDYIIPFRKDKKEAKAAYREYLKGKPFLPEIFSRENHIDEIKGVYVPFWLFDVNVRADMDYSAQKIRVWRQGDTEYTETKYYHVRREGVLGFDKIPADGSKKMDDAMMESVEPFDFQDAVPFLPAYLAGYAADRYDVSAEECTGRIHSRVKQSVENRFRDTVKGYDLVSPASASVNMSDSAYKYVLYPVWMLSTTWKGQNFLFAMNGQTGKLIGDLPADRRAFWIYVAKWSVVLGTLFSAAGWLLLR